ncbi:MAG: hydrogenase maturation peptidase HycI [Elusimicrobia bacterium]|nr:hydrogenase maturation peptidase HycI [Elusimicrobiota bacterium]
MKPVNISSRLYGKVLILGIGNSLKGDDGLGSEVIKRLHGKTPHMLLDTGSAPENYTKKIKELSPDTVVIVDAAELGASPGTIRIIDEKEITSGFFTTHNTPLNMFVDYIKMESEMKVIFIGVQPKSMKFGEEISAPVDKAIENLIEEFSKD